MIGALLAALFLLFLLVSAYFVFSQSSSSGALPYVKQDRLFTDAEINFYHALLDVVDGRFTVFGKVRIGDVITVKNGLGKKKAMSFRAKIQQKHFDFVVCDKKRLKIVGCIELNDSSHDTRLRKKRDHLVRSVCAAAGVPLVEIKAARVYERQSIQKQLTFLTN